MKTAISAAILFPITLFLFSCFMHEKLDKREKQNKLEENVLFEENCPTFGSEYFMDSLRL